LLLAPTRQGNVESLWGLGQKIDVRPQIHGGYPQTFLIDATGRIARKWPNVRVAGHADEVLSAARAL